MLLLEDACRCPVRTANMDAPVKIVVEDPKSREGLPKFAQGKAFPYLQYPDHDFTWQQEAVGQGVVLKLNAPSAKGLANGIYGLLQERLGFKFVHPRHTIVPCLEEWPLQGKWTFEGKPRFDKKGFHLHTMHPLELTQPLHDPWFPGGRAMLREYIDWLARNGQNYFDFSLMEGVDEDLDAWLAYAKEMVDYAHQRGVLVGVDISLHMLQQKSFQLLRFPPKSFRSFEGQVRDRLSRLLDAGWDVINLEFALAEFVGGMEGMRDRMRKVVLEVMADYPKVKMVGRQHVVKPESEIGGSHSKESMSFGDDPAMGLLVHTVMCYGLQDASAPVYELDDFSHLYEMLKRENGVREVWYYPESAYWVTFDNSIPLLLLPYLGARWRDIQAVEALGVPGHLTFSSGWEWGYWLMDWSIARWCWRYEQDGVAEKTWATQYLEEIFPQGGTAPFLRQLHDRMSQRWVQGDLLRHLCPTNPTDELPGGLSKQFQPRTPWHLSELRKPGMKDTLGTLVAWSQILEDEAAAMQGWIDWLEGARAKNGPPAGYSVLQGEILDALRVSVLRLKHRAALYRVLMSYDEGLLAEGTDVEGLRDSLYGATAAVRHRAVEIVRRQEEVYRYPLDLLAGQYLSYTAYDFGYLYTVHDLHFWEREEEQVRRKRKGPFFMNIYDLPKIAGLKD